MVTRFKLPGDVAGILSCPVACHGEATQYRRQGTPAGEARATATIVLRSKMGGLKSRTPEKRLLSLGNTVVLGFLFCNRTPWPKATWEGRAYVILPVHITVQGMGASQLMQRA